VRGKYWKVSRRKVVISSNTRQASILKAYGQSLPRGLIDAAHKKNTQNLIFFIARYSSTADQHLEGVRAVVASRVDRRCTFTHITS
jgi:hypothetical protein